MIYNLAWVAIIQWICICLHSFWPGFISWLSTTSTHSDFRFLFELNGIKKVRLDLTEWDRSLTFKWSWYILSSLGKNRESFYGDVHQTIKCTQIDTVTIHFGGCKWRTLYSQISTQCSKMHGYCVYIKNESESIMMGHQGDTFST